MPNKQTNREYVPEFNCECGQKGEESTSLAGIRPYLDDVLPKQRLRWNAEYVAGREKTILLNTEYSRI